MMSYFDRAIKHVLANNATAEAAEWVADQTKGPRVIGEFSESESKYIIGAAYSKGAAIVKVVGSQKSINEFGSIDILLIRCPKDKALREQLFLFEDQVAQESGFEGSVDEGQDYILLRWT